MTASTRRQICYVKSTGPAGKNPTTARAQAACHVNEPPSSPADSGYHFQTRLPDSCQAGPRTDPCLAREISNAQPAQGRREQSVRDLVQQVWEIWALVSCLLMKALTNVYIQSTPEEVWLDRFNVFCRCCVNASLDLGMLGVVSVEKGWSGL